MTAFALTSEERENLDVAAERLYIFIRTIYKVLYRVSQENLQFWHKWYEIGNKYESRDGI
jgi:hypothetical protein